MRTRKFGLIGVFLLIGGVVMLAVGISLSRGQAQLASTNATESTNKPVNDARAALPTGTALELKTYSAAQVKALIDRQEDMTIVNVDPLVYYEAERIKGSISLPVEEIEERYGELEPNKLVILYCA